MCEVPLVGVEALMRAKGYSVGSCTGLRVVAGTFQIDSNGTFLVHEVTIVSEDNTAYSADSTSQTKEARS